MLTVGPYKFSDRDVHRLLADGPEILTEYEVGRDPQAIRRFSPHFAINGGGIRGAGDHDADREARFTAMWEAWLALGPALRAAGQLPTTVHGRVDSVHVSDGGVPKRSVDELVVDWNGSRGDRQGNRHHHGSPAQALCVWSTEIIDGLRADGHPIFAGAAGENVTVSGLPWDVVRPGVRLQLGSVLCEVSCFATPCRHQAQWFADGDFSRLHEHRGRIPRAYATVLEPGTITTGDEAVLEPARAS